jgi:hypothetical protein
LRESQPQDTIVAAEGSKAATVATAKEDAEGVKEYRDMCARVVSKLAQRIQQRSDDNFQKEAKNRMVGAKKPEHGAFFQVIITPTVLEAYCQMRKTGKFGIDADYPEKCPQLWTFLSKVIAAQYDLEQ